MIKLIVGLGNPGAQYQHTRHNAGVWFVERLAQAWQTTLKEEKKFKARLAKIERSMTDHAQLRTIYLMIPTLYMNQNGESVASISHFYRFSPEELCVVHDDLDLAPGVAQFKCGGGTAGHNGLRDVIDKIGSPQFQRLRLGIGHPGHRDLVVDYVLKPPTQDEYVKINLAIEANLVSFSSL